MSDQFELQEGKPLRERDAGELTAPIKERAERASARAKQKVTAEDLVRRHEERAERRARDAQERREKRAGWVRTGTGIALLLTAGVTLFVTNGVRVQSAATEAENHAVITEMRDEIAYLEQLTGAEDGEDVDQAPQVEDVQATLDKVRTIATEVADLQNQFSQIVAADPVDPGNGAPS